MAFQIPPRILALDLDGTLINNYRDFAHPISRENLDALRELREAGTRILISTGRSASSARSVLERSGDPELAVCDRAVQNGALVIDGRSGELLYSRHLPKAEASVLLELFREFDLTPMLFENYSLGGTCLYDREPGNERLALYLSVRAQEEVGRDGLRKVEDLADYLDEDPLALGTIDLIPKVKAAGAAMAALDLRDSHVAVQGLVGWAGTERSLFLEAFHRDACKENAFRAYCGARGCEAGRAAAIGDGRNDMGLFGVVGLSIAMGNAPDMVMEAADHVAPPYDENGLATAIREHLLP